MTIIQIKNQNSEWGQIEFLHHKKKYIFPYHLSTGEVFNYDPPSLIRLKCCGLILATPLMTIARSVYWLAQSIFLIISESYQYLDDQEISKSNHAAIYDIAVDSLRAWKYGALMTGCAFRGVLYPYEERKRYGWLERKLNRHENKPGRDKFYLAFCFQRRCILIKDDLKSRNHVKNRLNRYLDFLDELRAKYFFLRWEHSIMSGLHSWKFSAL